MSTDKGNTAPKAGLEIDRSYEAAFDAYGVPTEYRTSDYFFFDYDEDGVPYAIPREFCGPVDPESGRREVFELHENGLAVSDSAIFSDSATGEARTIVHSAATVNDGASIERECVIGRGATVGTRAVLNTSVVVGDRSEVRSQAEVGPATSIGEKTRIENDVHVGSNVRIGDQVIVSMGTDLGDYCKIADDVLIEGDAVLETAVDVREGARVNRLAVIGAGSLLLERTIVGAQKKLRENTIVASRTYRKRVHHSSY